MIKPFKAANPKLTVKFTLIPNAEYYPKLQSAIAARSLTPGTATPHRRTRHMASDLRK
ncbi:hypothetical protein [Streptomyces sp. NPDC001601]|uniref:hypothetical protein n=1 Tax=Streptomyces sp. NPDC001601 TaxID=3364592 RepID=UPI0036BFBC68